MEQADQSPPGLDFCLWETPEAPGLGASQAIEILHPWTSGHSSLLELSCSELRPPLRVVTLSENAPFFSPSQALKLPLPRTPLSWQETDRLVDHWLVIERLASQEMPYFILLIS